MYIFSSLTFSLLSIFADLWMFFKISQIKPKLNWRLFLTIIIMLVSFGIYSSMKTYGIAFATIIEIIGFYLVYKNIRNRVLIIGTIVLVCTIDLLIDLGIDIASKIFPGIKLWGNFILLCLALFVINLFSSKINEILSDRNSTYFVYILSYIFISILFILFIPVLVNNDIYFYILIYLFLSLQIGFSVLAYYELVNIQKKLLDKQKQAEILDKQKQLEEYTEYLEKSEDELRAFRHDYKNILSSLKVSAQEGNVQEVVEKLDKYTETNLNSKALLKYKDVNHIHIKSVKSIIIAKLTEMYNLNIPYNFECRESIKKIPDHVNELDLVRIIGITMDNAIEESMSLINEGHNAVSAEVQIMMYSDSPDNFEYEIKNKIGNKKISTTQIQKSGYTTKKNHNGFGLANIKKIEDKYPDMAISYSIQNNFFDFYMSIDTEDGEE